MGGLGDEFCLTLITADPALAARADAAGVDCVGIDIERLDKSARQGHIARARISDHELSDLDALRPVVRGAALFARLNALHEGSRREVETALGHGARVLMLPFFTAAEEVDRFVRMVDGRAKIALLLETAAAVVRLHEILAVPGVDEVMVGLNDLHWSMGLADPFELAASDVMTMVSDLVRARDIRFGFGGLARAGDHGLPVPSDLVLAQHVRLGSGCAWISRSFFGAAPDSIDLGAEIVRLRDRLSFWAAQSPDALLAQRDELRRRLRSPAAAKL
jgi:2-keto-3-deoxy-L-rhamnonate aldolase RhmA